MSTGGVQSITGKKYTTNCPAMPEEFRTCFPGLASLKSAVRQQHHWAKAETVIMSIADPEQAVQESAEAEA